MALQILSEVENEYHTSDGQIFNRKSLALHHEAELSKVNVKTVGKEIARFQAEVPEWLSELNDKFSFVDKRSFDRVFDTAEEAALWEEAMEQARLQIDPVYALVRNPVAHTSGAKQWGYWDAVCSKPALYLFLIEIHFYNLKNSRNI
jgi:hypothetical protein